METHAKPIVDAARTTSIASSMMAVCSRSVGLQNGVRWKPIRTGVFYSVPPDWAAPEGVDDDDARRALAHPRGPLRGPPARLGRLRRRACRRLPPRPAPLHRCRRL